MRPSISLFTRMTEVDPTPRASPASNSESEIRSIHESGAVFDKSLPGYWKVEIPGILGLAVPESVEPERAFDQRAQVGHNADHAVRP